MRRATTYLYWFFLSSGAAIAALAIMSGAENIQAHTRAGYTWWGYPVLSSGVTGLALLLMTAAFAFVFLLRGSHLLAPVSFLAGYVALGFGAYVALLDIEKGGAPGPRAEMYSTVPLFLGTGLLIAAACLVWNYLSSRKPNA